MNKLKKVLFIGLLATFAATVGYAQQDHHHHHDGQAPAPAQAKQPDGTDGHCMGVPQPGMKPDAKASMQPQKVAHYFDGGRDIFAVVNDVDNSIDIIVDANGTPKRMVSDTVDIVAGVHELTKIYRPQSVEIIDGRIVYLAANSDSSIIRAMFFTPCGKLKHLNEVRFPGICNAFETDHGKLRVTGQNPLGYTVAVFDVRDGIENLVVDSNVVKANVLNYRKPKKAEVIASKDPIGVGLTVAAVSVVFLVLLSLAIIFTQYGRFLSYLQKRRAAKAAMAQGGDVSKAVENVDHSGEIDAVIAAAVYLYNEELHDEENTVITIKSVERPWTPWNAKFYNMNQNNFNNIRHRRH